MSFKRIETVPPSRGSRFFRKRPLLSYSVMSAMALMSMMLMWGAAQASAASWSIQPTPAPAGSSYYGLNQVSCVSATWCMAVGKRTLNSPMAEQWDGKEWKILEMPSVVGENSTSIFDVSCLSSTECWAVGSSSGNSGQPKALVEVWDGVSWKLQSLSVSGSTASRLASVSCKPIACFATGFYRDAAGTQLALSFKRSSGGEWTQLATPSPSGAIDVTLSGVSCSSGKTCTAVGNYRIGALGQPVSLAERFEGGAWKIHAPIVPSGAKSSQLQQVDCIGSECIATGSYTNSSGTLVLQAQRWKGAGWSLMSTPSPVGFVSESLNSVSCAAENDCMAVGNYTNGSGVGLTLSEHWDGKEWKLIETQNVAGKESNGLTGISCAAKALCTAVGSTSEAGYTKLQALVERYS